MPYNSTQECDVIIVGAGLSGLTCAAELLKLGQNTLVLEASDRAGGRIKSIQSNGNYLGDLGPSWVWPPYQPSFSAALASLNIAIEAQYDEGLGILDYEADGPVRYQRLPSQLGMARVSGGPQALIDRLLERIPSEAVRYGEAVLRVSETENGLKLSTKNSEYIAGHVVLAAPMRLVAETIDLPDSCKTLKHDMSRVPTWMAAQCKVVIEYKERFWRAKGLSGRVASQIGPMIEVHDHCSALSGAAALFGFVGIPYEVREQHRANLVNAIEEQLIRCFGAQAKAHLGITLQDWALEKSICSQADRISAGAHPDLAPAALRRSHLEGRLHFAVAELSGASPGLIDGALQIGSEVANRVAGHHGNGDQAKTLPQGISRGSAL